VAQFIAGEPVETRIVGIQFAELGEVLASVRLFLQADSERALFVLSQNI
jgi:hypothetical protein